MPHFFGSFFRYVARGAGVKLYSHKTSFCSWPWQTSLWFGEALRGVLRTVPVTYSSRVHTQGDCASNVSALPRVSFPLRSGGMHTGHPAWLEVVRMIRSMHRRWCVPPPEPPSKRHEHSPVGQAQTGTAFRSARLCDQLREMYCASQGGRASWSYLPCSSANQDSWHVDGQ